jgi:ankyrin repeat protein
MAIVLISPNDARLLSVSLFKAMETLSHADTLLHSMHLAESPILATLFRASQTALSSCEFALTHVEPFYDTHTFCDFTDSSCRTLVTSTLEHADIVVAALEYAFVCLKSSPDLPLPLLCGDDAMHAAIDASDLGAISLGVVLVQESPPHSSSQLVHFALRSRSTKCVEHVVRILMSVPSVAVSASEIDGISFTALMHASQRRNIESVNALLVCPFVVASANTVNCFGDTALMIASARGHAEIVNALLACPIVVQNAGAANHRNHTALMLASMHGHTETVIALLTCPVIMDSASTVNTIGRTTLMLASMHGYTETVIALLKYPVIMHLAHFADIHGNTALMLASHYEHIETVIALRALLKQLKM